MEIPTAGLAEAALRSIGLAAVATSLLQERTAGIAIIRISVNGTATLPAFHGFDPDPIGCKDRSEVGRRAPKRPNYITKTISYVKPIRSPIGGEKINGLILR